MTPSDPKDGASSPSDVGARGAGSTPVGAASRREIWNDLDQSSIMTVELMAAILTWGGIGWLLDRWLGTRPWLFGIGVLLGFGAGLYLVWLRSKDPQHPGDAAGEQRSDVAHRDEETNGS